MWADARAFDYRFGRSLVVSITALVITAPWVHGSGLKKVLELYLRLKNRAFEEKYLSQIIKNYQREDQT